MNIRPALFLCVLLLSLTSVKGQNILDSNNVWTSVFVSWGGNCVTYDLRGDTIINGLNYARMFRTDYNETDTVFSLYDYVHDDGDGRIYRKKPQEQESIKLYDFNLEAGSWSEPGIYVDSTDYIITSDGISRKRMFVTVDPDNECWSDVWIEGIGSTMSGFDYIWTMCVGDLNEYLKVFYVWNSELGTYEAVHETGTLPNYNCDIVMSTPSYPAERVSLFPNPASSQVTVDAESDKVDEIVVYDILGHVVLRQSNPDAVINISQLSPGLYTMGINHSGTWSVATFVRSSLNQ